VLSLYHGPVEGGPGRTKKGERSLCLHGGARGRKKTIPTSKPRLLPWEFEKTKDYFRYYSYPERKSLLLDFPQGKKEKRLGLKTEGKGGVISSSIRESKTIVSRAAEEEKKGENADSQE